MDTTFIIIIFLLYIIAWSLGPKILNKFKTSKNIYLNTRYDKFKSKYTGYTLLVITLLAIIYKNTSLFTAQRYYTFMILIIGILMAVTLIYRNNQLNQKYINKKDNAGDRYFVDFIKSSFIIYAIICLIINFISTQSNIILDIIVMIVLAVEVILLIISGYPDRIYDYFKINNYTFTYHQYYYLVVVLALIPPIIMMILIFLLTII